MYFATNLSYLRKEKGLTQETIGRELGLTAQAIGLYESGDREPSFTNLIYLAKTFDVTIDELLIKDLRPPKQLLSMNLKYLRKKAGYEKKEMAKLLGFHDPRMYGNVEECYDVFLCMGIPSLINVSEFFGVSVDDLLKKDLSKGVIEGANAGEKDCG